MEVILRGSSQPTASMSAFAPAAQAPQAASSPSPAPAASQSSSISRVIIEENGLKPPESSTGPEAWQAAVDLTSRGDGKQRQNDFSGALNYYTCAVTYYNRAINSTEDILLTPERKVVIKEQLKSTLTKIDTIQRVGSPPNMRRPQTSYSAISARQFQQQQPLSSSYSQIGSQQQQQQPQSLSSSYSQLGSDDCVCWACKRPMESTMSALGHMWHPQCFINNVHCGFCGKPFSLLNLRFVIGKEDGKPYHVACRDYTLGLSQKIEKTFVGGTGTMFIQVSLKERRIFHAGESVSVEFVVDNNSSVKLMSVKVLLIREEARAERKSNGERCESKAVSTPVLCVESNLGKKLPLGMGVLSETVLLPISPDIQGSVLGDVSFRREYKLKTRCIISGIHNSVDMEFPVIIETPNSKLNL